MSFENYLNNVHNEIKQVEKICEADGKFCKNCGQIKLGYGSCIDMTCWRGYIDGNHDGWISQEKGKEIQANPYAVSDDDYKCSIRK